MIIRNKQDLEIIVGIDEAGGFGANGKIPWNEPDDLRHFREVTSCGHCIMGRRTYEDMYEMRKDKMKEGESILPGRSCYVVTSSNKVLPGATAVKSISGAMENIQDSKRIFVIGGRRLFIQALAWAKRIHLTIVEGVYDCDVFFPIDCINDSFKPIHGEVKGKLKFVTYTRTST